MEVKDQKGHIRQVHVTDVKKTTMPEVITNAIPDYSAFWLCCKASTKSQQSGRSQMDHP